MTPYIVVTLAVVGMISFVPLVLYWVLGLTRADVSRRSADVRLTLDGESIQLPAEAGGWVIEACELAARRGSEYLFPGRSPRFPRSAASLTHHLGKVARVSIGRPGEPAAESSRSSAGYEPSPAPVHLGAGERGGGARDGGRAPA